MKTKIAVFIFIVMIFSCYAQETVGGRVAKNAKEKTYDSSSRDGIEFATCRTWQALCKHCVSTV